MSLISVTGTSFVRDISSMGLSNINPKEREEYYEKLRIIESQKSDLNNVRSEIDNLKSDITEIKQLLIKLMDKT